MPSRASSRRAVVGDGPCAVPRDPEGFALAFVFSSVSSAFICGCFSLFAFAFAFAFAFHPVHPLIL